MNEIGGRKKEAQKLDRAKLWQPAKTATYSYLQGRYFSPFLYVGLAALYLLLQPARVRLIKKAVLDYIGLLAKMQARQPALFESFSKDLLARIPRESNHYSVDKVAFSVGRAHRHSSGGGSAPGVAAEFVFAMTVQQILDFPATYARSALAAARPLAEQVNVLASDRVLVVQLRRVLLDLVNLLKESRLGS